MSGEATPSRRVGEEAGPLESMLVLVTGLPGSGKSTIADHVGRRERAPVLSHDWAMSGLRPYPELQATLDQLGPRGHRDVGWSILLALARSHLRRRCSVVLDGVARGPQIELCRQVAAEETSQFVVIHVSPPDAETHRKRIEGRRRAIPNWYELDWPSVERARQAWEPISDADLQIDSTDSLEQTHRRVDQLLAPSIHHQ